MCSSSALVSICVLVGCVFVIASVSGIGLSLFLLFGDPFLGATDGTYKPSFEDIGPAFIVSTTSLVMNILLIGGAKQGSKEMLLGWVVWKIIAIVIFWLWYGYNELKHYNYIDWTHAGMKSCYFCGQVGEKYVGMVGAAVSVSIVIGFIPIEILRAKLKKRHRELTELTDLDSVHGSRGANSMRYIHDNQYHSQQDLASLTSVPLNQQNSYNQPHQQYKYHSQQQINPANLNNHISQNQYQQMGHTSQQNYLMQQHLLQQHRNQQQQQNFNYQPTHPAYYY